MYIQRELMWAIFMCIWISGPKPRHTDSPGQIYSNYSSNDNLTLITFQRFHLQIPLPWELGLQNIIFFFFFRSGGLTIQVHSDSCPAPNTSIVKAIIQQSATDRTRAVGLTFQLRDYGSKPVMVHYLFQGQEVGIRISTLHFVPVVLEN